MRRIHMKGRVRMRARVAGVALAACGACGLIAAVFVPAGARAIDSAEGTPVAQAVVSIGITVDDLDRSVAFFTGVLDFEKTGEMEVAGPAWERLTGVFGVRLRIATLRLGDETVELTDYLAPRGRPFPDDTRANDRWFQHLAIVVSDMDAAYARLRAAHVEHASTGPQRLPESIPNAAGIRAFYFRDPDGHFLELLEFPADKGDARWHRATDGGGAKEPLFLGIDHTAIVVADTDRALAFYRDALGMTVSGGSENSGTEQEHLNNVEHAHLRITSLRAPSGPGIELLEYLEPRTGRAPAETVRANDLAYWKTRIRATRLGSEALRGVAERFAATPVELPRDDSGTRVALVIRDVDGHAIELTGDD